MGKREYYARVGWRKYFDLDHSPRVERFLNANGLVIFNQLLENVEEAIKENIGEILILVHQNASAIVSVKHEDYKEVLEFSLNGLINNERGASLYKIDKAITKFNQV